MTISDSYNGDDDEGLVFPVVIPRKTVGSIFDHDMDVHRKVYESPDKRSLMLYCCAGRDISVATLKPDSRFKTVQEAYGALGFDPVPAEAKVKMLSQEVVMLKQMVLDQAKKIQDLEVKVGEISAKVNN